MTSTYVVELTPAGRGAVAVVLVAGPDAIRAVENRFVPAGKQSIGGSPIGRILFGRWGETGEELVVCRRNEDRIEIHCHGGGAAVRAVVDALKDDRCQRLSWQDWLRKTSLNSIQSDAQIALADAVTMRTAAILLDQLNGALTAAMQIALAAIEAEDWPRADGLIRELLDRRDVGMHLTTPWRVVLVGAPNVGKSSLINALAGYDRAIVAPTPGTTRDVVTLITAIDGWPVQLADTAGMRATEDELESAGVELAQATLATADLAIFVHDATAPQTDSAYSESASPPRAIYVRNKVDLLDEKAEQTTSAVEPVRGQTISVSALTGAGIGDLIAAIGQSLVPKPPANGAAVPFLQTQIEALVVARNAIQRQHASAVSEALQSMLAAADSDAQGSEAKFNDDE
jgi:tRNA modification GTPase